MLAVGANADNAQQVLGNFKLMLRRHGILQRFELSRKELDDLATLRTNHVIVMLVFVVVFVVRAPIAEANLARQAGFGQEFQGAIDSSLTDGRVFFFDELVEIFVREVFFSTQKNVQNQVTLRRPLQPPSLDVFKKDFLFFGWLLGRGHQCQDFTTWGHEGKECGVLSTRLRRHNYFQAVRAKKEI